MQTSILISKIYWPPTPDIEEELMLKKDYIPTEEALDFFMAADIFKKQDETQ
jgi:hypothetical protein